MDIINGNILVSGKDIIVQQVNCRGKMGSGLAKSIMDRYDNVRPAYLAFHQQQKKKGLQDEDLLGMVHYVDTYDGTVIANIFGQVDIRKNQYDTTVYTKKDALLKGIQSVKEKAEQHGFSVAIPTYIGCGLAGGNWDEIRPAIESIFSGSSVDVCFYHYR